MDSQKQCSAGHFYDAKEHSACPYCGVNLERAGRTEQLAGGHQASTRRPADPTEFMQGAPGGSPPQPPHDVTTPMKRETVRGRTQPATKGTVILPQGSRAEPPRHEASDHLGRSRDREKTVFHFQASSAEYPDGTDDSRARGFDPTVGWLVCVAGAERGTDFRLKAGRNWVGRNPGAHVPLLNDNSISRDEKAAFIIFDQRFNAFKIAPGDGRTIIYCNGESVDMPMRLNDHDELEIGHTKLRFLSLCGERFQWTD